MIEVSYDSPRSARRLGGDPAAIHRLVPVVIQPSGEVIGFDRRCECHGIDMAEIRDCVSHTFRVVEEAAPSARQ